jgi:hypothetical protein
MEAAGPTRDAGAGARGLGVDATLSGLRRRCNLATQGSLRQAQATLG